jgi:transposase
MYYVGIDLHKRDVVIAVEDERGPVTSREVICFVRYLLQVCPKPLMLFWDALGAHWSRRTRKALGRLRNRLTLHRLPAYAPQINPIEGLYAHLKGHLLRAYCPPDLPTLQRFLRRAVRNVQSRARLIRPFFHRPPLSS